MPGGLIQLSAIGKENVFLTINPQISYFRNVYKRYSNFSKINFNLNISYKDNNSSLFQDGVTARFKIPKNGDLIKDFYLKITLPGLYADADEVYDVKWTDNISYNIIDYITFSIGGREIQSFDSEFLYIYYKTNLDNTTYKNFEKCVNTEEISKDSLDVFTDSANYNSNKNESLYSVEINTDSFVTSGALPTQYVKNKYYENGYYKQPVDIILPIPVWFKDEPFPITALSYMDLDVTVKLKPLSELVLIRKLKINKQLESKSLFIPKRKVEDEALLEGFLQGKSTVMLNVDGFYNTDVYSVPADAEKVSSNVPEYVDFNLDGYLGPNPNTTLNNQISSNSSVIEIDSKDTKIITTDVYIVNISYFLDNLDNIFRVAVSTIDLPDNSLFSNIQITDSGIGYYVPPPYSAKLDSNTGLFQKTDYYFAFETTDSSGNPLDVNEYLFSRDKINNADSSVYSEALKTILKSVFPKLYVIDNENNRFDNVVQVSKIDTLGQIKEIELIGSPGLNDVEGFIKNPLSSTYKIEIYNLNPQTMNVEFNLLAIKDYDYNDTVYRNGVTKHSFNSFNKFAPLIDIKVKNKGKYYIGSPGIFLYGQGSNFSPYVEYTYTGGYRSISRIDINSKTPLGFLFEPEIKYSSLTPNDVNLHPSLGVYTVWWYPFGLFRTINDKYTDEELPEKTYLTMDANGRTVFDKDNMPQTMNEENYRLYRDRQLNDNNRITNLGKPHIKLIDSIGKNAKVDAVISDNGVGGYKIINEGTGYTSNEASINYSNSITSGSYLTFISINIVNGNVKSVNIGNKGRNYSIGDIINITGGNGDAYIEVTSLDNGVISDVEILNAGENYTSGTTYQLTNEQSGDGAIFTVSLQQISVNGVSTNVIKSVNVIKSGKNYNKFDPEVIIVNNENDSEGYGAFMTTKVEDGQITDISPLNEEDRGYEYNLVPYAVVNGSNAFIATIDSFDSNGGINSITVEDSFKWPKNVIDDMYTALGGNNEYSDKFLFTDSSATLKLVDDSKVQYYLEVLVKGPGKGARLAAKKTNFKLVDNNQYYILESIEVINKGQNYNNTTIQVVDKDITNTNADGAKFNITLDYRGRVSANILESGQNYQVGDKFKIIGGKFNNNETPETSYITVQNTNMDGGIISILVEPGLGYMNTNSLGIRDFYYFYPRPILGINRIDVINGGSNLKENPEFYIEDPVNTVVSKISDENYQIKLSNYSIVDYLETNIVNTDSFISSNISNFLLVLPSGTNLKLNYYKSLLTNYTIYNEGFSYNKGNIVTLSINHNFKGYKTKNNPDNKFIIGRFKITSVGETGNVTGVEPYIEYPLDFTSKYIDLYYRYNSTDSTNYTSDNNENNRLLFEYTGAALNISNDNISPNFEITIKNNIITDIYLLNKGRNLKNSPIYNILNKYIDPNNTGGVVSYEIPIVGVYDEENQNISEIITYMGKNYKYDPYISITNLGSFNISDTAIIYTEQLKVETGFLEEKLVYKFNIASGNGYRHPPSIIAPPPNLVSSNMRNAILETECLGSLHYVDIIDGGDNFESVSDFDWNSSDYDDEIILQPIIYEGSIQNIIVVTSPTKYTSDIDIKISHKRGLSKPVIVNSIMNFHVTKINILDNGFGYSSSTIDSDGNEVIILEYDRPCPDKYGNLAVENFYPAKAAAVIQNCRINYVYPLSGAYTYLFKNDQEPNIADFKIQIDILNEDNSQNIQKLSKEAIENSIEWIKIDNIWYIYSYKVAVDLNLPFIKTDDLPNGTINYTELVSVDNEDSLFPDGKRLSVKLYESSNLRACDVDRSQLNSGFLKNDHVYILDDQKYQEAVTYHNTYGLDPINIYDYKQVNNLGLVIANHKILFVENQTIYSITYDTETEYNYRNIVNSIKTYNDLQSTNTNNNNYTNELKIVIKQLPDLVAEIYPFFSNLDYSDVDWESNTNSFEKIQSLEIVYSSEYFENEGNVGYRGGGLFDASIIMEAGIVRFINKGNNYDFTKEPLYDVSPSYEIDKFKFYKNKYLETYQGYKKTNGGIEGDNNDNLLVDNGESGGIVNFIKYYNEQILFNTIETTDATTGNTINVYKLTNDYTAELAAIFISTLQEGCEPSRNLGAYRYINNYRGYYFFSKPIIIPNGSYNESTTSTINLLPYTKINNTRDFNLIFKSNINTYKIEYFLEYIFIEDSDLKNYLKFDKQFFIPQYNKITYTSIENDIDIDYSTYGSTKDLLIFARRSDAVDRNQLLNFTKLDSEYQIKEYNNYISNYYIQYAVQKEINLSSSVSEYIENNFDNSNTILDTLSKFINTTPGTYTIVNNIQDMYSNENDNTKLKYISYEQGLSVDDITEFREFWSFRNLEDIPIINTNNYLEFTPEIINSMALTFNNMTREEEKPYQYYNTIQMYNNYNQSLPGLIMYSFAFNPLDTKPTGTCNFSHINKVQLKFKINAKSTDDRGADYKFDIIVYNRFYNVLVCKSGIAELMFFK